MSRKSEKYQNILESTMRLEKLSQDSKKPLSEFFANRDGDEDNGIEVSRDNEGRDEFGDEGKGGEDTSWSDDNETITLEEILELTKDIKTIEYPTEKLAKIVLNWDNNPEEIERISQVDISSQYPILIMVNEQGKIQWILDGNHRAQKALRAKIKTIPAKLIKPSNLNRKAKKILLDLVNEVGDEDNGVDSFEDIMHVVKNGVTGEWIDWFKTERDVRNG